jgi:hypothetical protein
MERDHFRAGHGQARVERAGVADLGLLVLVRVGIVAPRASKKSTCRP